MWVRFWYRISNSSEEEESYIWQSPRSSDIDLKEYAIELVPEWVKYDCAFSYGFEKIDKPPVEELNKLQKIYQSKIDDAKYMLDIIQKDL